MRSRFAFSLALVMAALPLLAQEQAYVRRGDVTRQGKVWVEEVECGASVRPDGRLVLRTDMGSVMVETGRACTYMFPALAVGGCRLVRGVIQGSAGYELGIQT